MAGNNMNARPFDEAGFKEAVKRLAKLQGVPVPPDEDDDLPELPELPVADDEVVEELRAGHSAAQQLGPCDAEDQVPAKASP